MDLWKRMKQNKNITTHDPCFLKNIELSSTHVATQHRQTTLPSPGLYFFANVQLRFPVSNKQIQRSPIWKNDHIGRLWISDELVHHDHPESFFYVQPLWFWSQITNGTKLKFHLLKIVYTSLKKYRNTISHNSGPTRPAKCTGMKACQDQELEWVL